MHTPINVNGKEEGKGKSGNGVRHRTDGKADSVHHQIDMSRNKYILM